MSNLKIDCHAKSEKGPRKVENQDHFLIADLVKAVRIQQTSLGYAGHASVSGHSHGKVLLVADGMGGSNAGKRAANLAIDETINYMVNRMQWYAFQSQTNDSFEKEQLNDDLIRAIEYCQSRIQDEAEWSLERRGMGTTLTFGLVDWPMVHIVHVGDSRCYRLRNTQLEQLTRDHTMAQVFQEAGRAIDSGTEETTLNNTLWNVVGGSTTDLSPEVYSCHLRPGDKLLFATDGLTKELSDNQIAEILGRDSKSSELCDELVNAAVSSGGSDNITCVVAQFREYVEVAAPKSKEIAVESVVEDEIGRQNKNADVSLKPIGKQQPAIRRSASATGSGTTVEAESTSVNPSCPGQRPYGDPSRKVVYPTGEPINLFESEEPQAKAS